MTYYRVVSEPQKPVKPRTLIVINPKEAIMAKKNPVKNVHTPDAGIPGAKIGKAKKGATQAATKLASHRTGGLKGRTKSKPNAPYGKTA